MLLHFFVLRLDACEAWLDFLEVGGRLDPRLPWALLWRRDLDDDEVGFRFCV